KLAFSEARAAILLFKQDATDAEKLEAIATIKARGDQEALALLTGLAGDQPLAIARAAANATSAIQSNLAMWSAVQNAWCGLSLVLQQAVRTMFGPTNREVGNPSWMSGAFDIGQITITYNRLWILCFTLAVFAILLAMLRYTSLGLEMRAVTQNRRMAATMGIATSRVDALTFGLGSGIAGIAGVALSQIDNVSPNLGR